MRTADGAEWGRIEDWLAAGESLPRVAPEFRARILSAATPVHRESRTLQQVQSLIAGALALTLLLGLPGFYQSLRQPTLKTLATLPRMTPWNWSPTARAASHDNVEWSFVEVNIASRDYAARAIRGAL